MPAWTKPDGVKTTAKPHGNVEFDGLAGRIRIDPNQNVIIGAANIKRYIGVRSYSTLWRWVELFSFPAVKRPDGLWMTTMTAVDQWIFLAAEAALDAQAHARSINVSAEKALRRLQAQIANGTLRRENTRVALKTAQAVGLVDPAKKIDMRKLWNKSDNVAQPHSARLSESATTDEIINELMGQTACTKSSNPQ